MEAKREPNYTRNELRSVEVYTDPINLDAYP